MKHEGPSGGGPFRESGGDYQRIELSKEINPGDKIPSFDEATKEYGPEDIKIYSEKFGIFTFKGKTIIKEVSLLNLKKNTNFLLHYVSEIGYELIIQTNSRFRDATVHRLNYGTKED